MLIEIPDIILKKSKFSEQEIKVELALFLYKKKIMTLGQASKFANLNSFEFQKKLGKRKIPVNYSEEDFDNDLKTIKKIFG